jgi:hypothetical protein
MFTGSGRIPKYYDLVTYTVIQSSHSDFSHRDLARPPVQTGSSDKPLNMTLTCAYPHSRLAQLRRSVVALVLAVATVGVLAGPADAARMGDEQEALISAGAKKALVAIDKFADERDMDAYDLYLSHADYLAVQVANFLGLDVRSMQRAWRGADVAHQRALMAGLTQLGVPYKANGAQADVALDCSGLVAFAWSSAGVEMPRGSTAQFSSASQIKARHAQPGDIIWRPGHISMYLGIDTAILQTPYSGRSVELHVMEDRIASWVRFADPMPELRVNRAAAVAQRWGMAASAARNNL